MSDVAARPATPAAAERGFTQLVYQLDDYPGPTKTALFGIQHVLVMFTAMVGGPLIVARLLNLSPAVRIEMVTGTMIGCGIATMISALGLGFIGPRLPIVMGVFYIFIGPIVAISKDVSLAAAMTALMIGGLVQFAWSPLIGKMQRFFPAIVTGTTILLIGTGLMKIGINVATGLNTPSFGTPLTLGLAVLMIVLIIVISVYARGFIRTLSLFVTMVIGYVVSAALGLLNFQSVTDASWVSVPMPLPFGGLEWPGLIGIVTVIVCFFATAVETTGHTLAVCRHHGRSGRGLAHSRRGIQRWTRFHHLGLVRRHGAHVLLAEHRCDLAHRRRQPLRRCRGRRLPHRDGDDPQGRRDHRADA
jgi:xanthine/uracil permease